MLVFINIERINMPEDEVKALNTEAEEENSLDTPPVSEEQATEETDQPVQAEETESVESESRKGANNRIRELNSRAKEAEAKAKSLEERLSKFTSPIDDVNTQPKLNQPINKPLVGEDEEITVAELNRRIEARDRERDQQVLNLTRFETQRQKVLDNIDKEAKEVTKIYAQLDPNNKENFDSDLSDAIFDATEAFIRANPTGSVKAFVNKLMKPLQKNVNKEVANQTEEIAKQVAQGAIRPTMGVKQTAKKTSDMTIAELEAKLGVVQS